MYSGVDGITDEELEKVSTFFIEKGMNIILEPMLTLIQFFFIPQAV